MKKFAFLVVLITVAFVSNAQQTTFILMRHAEKVQDGSKDPALTKEGIQRSMKLKELLVSQEINAVYSTPYARTRATVAPTAKANELAVTEYKPMEKGFLKETLDKHLGETILIAGHSNTIPDLVNELIGDKKYSQLDENDYNYLFIVTVSEIGQGKEVVISY
ncbi:MAG: histidine phosphatase family protein [Flammeovirgaceae bacterium]|nr:histidine phosphatase family protein [Flammeovirgaceae bacterium]MBE63556.1 histidine phosphatase family protein [Flammeovirgaceae bacterium]HCX23318.1 histidine phosphatase family protein [Cytophagales bacterium]|tara:strand:- start:42 stop:530 length:489 start_codon:yes stop_codon:yes gene_type:complete